MTPQPGNTVEVNTTFRHLKPDELVEVNVTLVYRSADPYNVHVIFHPTLDNPESIWWILDRATLRKGHSAPVFYRDFQVFPSSPLCSEFMFLVLHSPDGRAELEIPPADITAFLRDTYAAVPEGKELGFLDVDQLIADILWQHEGFIPRARQMVRDARRHDNGPGYYGRSQNP